jgi:hypothetical protein
MFAHPDGLLVFGFSEAGFFVGAPLFSMQRLDVKKYADKKEIICRLMQKNFIP